ncbi:MAG: ATP-binding cassette domain-containing protein [Pseudomonadota bacterium]
MSQGLIVNKLTKQYANGVKALNGVGLNVPRGLYGLLGPNGAGKSTLMRTIATLQMPDSGSIELDGMDVLNNPEKLRKNLGYLPQTIGAYPGVSALSLMSRFAWLKGFTEKSARDYEIAQILERVNLTDAANRNVAEYSGGMLRRFGIGLALIGEPRLLIVDEPTAGLDPMERNRFHRVLSDVSEDAAVLLSTHIVEDVENLCDDLSILVAGQIVASGSPKDLITPLDGQLFSKVFAKGEPVPKSALRVLANPKGLLVIVRARTAPNGFKVRSASLEDAYHVALENVVSVDSDSRVT